MKLLKDNLKMGIVLGFIAPVMGMLAFKMYNFPTTPIGTFFNDMFLDSTYRPLLSSFLTISLLVNALVFTIFIQFEKDKTAKGVFITTAIYGFIILLIKTFA